MKNSSWLKRSVILALLLFLLMNIVAAFHAYKLTHFAPDSIKKTKSPDQLTLGEKLNTLFFGVSNPRPENKVLPTIPYTTIRLSSNKKLVCWSIQAYDAKGTVVLFHGFSGEKSMLLDQAEQFRQEGYSTLLVDFMGSGYSEGNQTTIGFYEAEQVKSCVEYLKEQGEKNIILYGASMGAVAIMKSISDLGIQPQSVILECPFGSMYQTVCARFNTMHIPSFPMAGLLVFWGGLLNNFWAFGHNPVEYAKSIECPVLLLYGELDEKVSKEETSYIFKNLAGQKILKIYPDSGHESYLRHNRDEWQNDIGEFLKRFN